VTIANVDVVRRFYDALNANDLGAIRSLCDDAIEYVNPDTAAEPGIRVGPDEFRRAFEGLHASFDDFRCEAVSTTEIGDAVVAVARSTGSGRISDIPFTEVHGHLLVLHEGRIASFQWFQSVEEACSKAYARGFQQGMEAYSRGDWEAALEGFHPDVEWSVEPDLGPVAQVYRGHDGVRRFWEDWAEVIEGMALEIEECRALEDGWVIAVTRASGTGAGSGAAVASREFAQLGQYRDGQVVRVRLFGDVKRALAAAGAD
jgi:ketosteroid isomerase-like protein